MKPCKSPDVQEDMEKMRTRGLGGVECLEEGEGGFDRGRRERGGVVGRGGCLLLFKRQWVLCAD